MKGSAALVISEPKVDTVCALHSRTNVALLRRLRGAIAASGPTSPRRAAAG
jgi:hypothetical protein